MTTDDTARLGFHEASIVDISQEANALRLLLEGVHASDTEVITVSVTFVNVRTLLREDYPVEGLTMERPDNEVLTLSIVDHSAELIVLWTDFQKHEEDTVYYRIECERIVVLAIAS